MTKHKPPTAAPDLNRIKKLVVMAMFSDDGLMQRFVLKGGNAIDLVYEMGTRASLDIDLSMTDGFRPDELNTVRQTIERNLQATFRAEGYEAFDVTLDEKPAEVTPDLASFWGGYLVTFKLIEHSKHTEFRSDVDALRRNAVRIGTKGKFEVDISGFEYCTPKQKESMEGLQIFVYTPEMLVFEKLRAVCQQMPEYGPIVKRGRPGSARARDFLDIYTLVTHRQLQLETTGNRELLKHIFEAKRVPLEFLHRIKGTREFHRPDFDQVRDTVKPGIKLESFDFYFDYVARLSEALGNV